MVQINFAQKQVTAKIVYYGPGMSGKTTNLEVIHQRAPEPNKGDLTSISTDGDRTLFFDFMPLDLGTVAGMRTCFQIYTVPGQVYYNSTRKLVLQGVDGVVFIADSGANLVQENLESLRNLEENLNEYGKSLATLPHVIQFNKRDLPDALPVEQLNQMLNAHNAPCYEAVASTGQGVFPTLKALAARVLESIHTNPQSGQAPSKPQAPARPGAALPGANPPAMARPQPATAGLARTGFHAQGAPNMPAPMGQAPGAGYGQMPQGMPPSAPQGHVGGYQNQPAGPQGQAGQFGAFAARPGAFAQPGMQPGAGMGMQGMQAGAAMPATQQPMGGMGGMGAQPMNQGFNQGYGSSSAPMQGGNGPAAGGLNLANRQPNMIQQQRPATRPPPAPAAHLEGTRFKPRQAPRQEVKPTPTGSNTKSRSNPALIIVLAVVGVGALAAIVLSFL